MVKKLYSHNNFMGGQVDRELLGKAPTSMSYSRNVVSSLKGELRTRTGTKFLMNLPENSVVIPFRKDENDVVAIFGNTNLKLYDLTDDGISELQNGAKAKELVQTWTSNTTNGYTVGMNTGLSGSTQAQNAYQAFMPTGLWNWTANYSSHIGWLTFEIDPSKNQMLNKFVITFSSYGFTDEYSLEYAFRNGTIQYSDDGITWFPARTFQNNYKERIITGQVIILNHGTYGRTWEISYELICGESTPHRYYRIWFLPETHVRPSSFPEHKLVVRTFLQSNTLEPFSAALNLTNEQLKNIKYSQFENKMYLTTYPQIQPKLLSLSNNFFELNDYTPQSPSNFWTLNGFPSCVRHFQGRLIFAGYDNFPARITGSKFLDDTNFQVSQNVVATDPIDATCNELKSEIKNIWGGVNALYAMSEDGISMINAQNGVISPNDINFRLKNTAPANSMTPTVKDDVMFYLSANRKRIYVVDFDWNLQRYVVNDITKHIQDYLKDEIAELHFAEDKSRLIYGLMDNGGWFALLFDKASGIMSIFPFETSGKVRDISIIKHGSDYKLLMVVERERGLVLEEKLPAQELERFYLQTQQESQDFSSEKIMSNFYMDMVQHIKIDQLGLPDPISFDINSLTITTTTANNNIYNMANYVGCQLYCYNDRTGNSLHITITNVISNTVFGVILHDDSEITETINFSAWITSQTKILPTLEPNGTKFEIIGDNNYIGKLESNNNAITLEQPLWDIFYGLPFEKIAIITEIGNPMQSKLWGTVSLVLQDTLNLEIGAKKEKLENLIEYRPTNSQYNVVPKMFNGIIGKNIADTDEFVKNLVLYSDKALPFCVIGLTADGSISDMGGN